MAFNVVPNPFKPAIFSLMMKFCSEHNMLPLISTQLEAIDAIAERYAFPEQDRLALYNQAINLLKKEERNLSLSNTLYKILLECVRRYEHDEQAKEKVQMLYTLAITLYSVSQYNQLVELPAYSALKTVHRRIATE